MKTINQMQEELQDVFAQLKSGKMDIATGEALHNNVGKQIGLTNIQLKYAELKEEKPDIKFLNNLDRY